MTEEEKKAIEIVKGIAEVDLLNYWEGSEEPYNAIQTILNLIEKQEKEIEILIAQRDEARKDSDKWFKRLQEKEQKFIERNERKDKIIDKLIECLAEERGTDEDEIREVFGCE